MNIIEKRIDEIIPYEKNPRRNDKAVTYVVNSIKQFGFKVPLVINKDGVIVCGHTRWKAAKRLKMKTVPCLVADDLTDEQIRAFRLADNKVAEIADWDVPMLNFELGELKEFFDFSDFGFDFKEEKKNDEKNKASGSYEKEHSEIVTVILKIKGKDVFEEIKTGIEKCIEGKDIIMEVNE